ncbi:late competence development ComFB family protein [Paenibacillus radicis (ex Xue et al. 2023)]|uniref:Late competence development ComFB family protein n=1 Tax=Paenibacillus radicis (ex Xue et al. 2023) TaxID=2972489 RepID=A0ABT1YP86_9BACL|nr:late competence development ComFB family protein [Paenibacillus radicis (ex Xue et al. 2023)]MCR8634982.1 late competence development ComFB family protein [Paenibacillus radicis (ex Xue et al. 2023)]
MNVHNLMEDIVKSCLKDLLQHQTHLRELDEKLQGDIIAIALNQLPPKYVSTDRGEVFAKTQLRSQVETDVYRELANAIEKVLNSSRPSELEK